MKAYFHKITSLLLALLVLGSTSSFSVAKHYCGEHLIDVAWFGDAEPCAMEMMLDAKYGPSHDKKSECCKDEKIVIEGQDELKLQFDTITIDTVVFLQTFIVAYKELFKEGNGQRIPFDGYPPPLITQDYQLLYDQFLI